MAIRIKVANSQQEIDDALWIRHEVFVVEDGKFGGKPLPDARIIDRFDAFPYVWNIIAYDGVEPIATIRLTRENQLGLPAEKYFDFNEYRKAAANQLESTSHASGESKASPVFGSAGMLAVRERWRKRRDVIRAMYKVAAGVCASSDVTHIVAAVNHQTANMYRRLGFSPLTEKFWIEEIGEYVISLAATAENFCEWAFRDLPRTPLTVFKDSFERVFLRAGEKIFSEGDEGREAYIIQSGNVRITCRRKESKELMLAHMLHGDLFGELALIDEKPRSATAVAITDAELITLDRDAFMRDVSAHPDRIRHLLEVFTERLRHMDDMVMALAFSPKRKRLEFALGLARLRTIPDRKHTGQQVFKGGPSDLASSAAVDEVEARRFLDRASEKGELTYSQKTIRFLR
jgi:CRP-like cAMP-binding protein